MLLNDVIVPEMLAAYLTEQGVTGTAAFQSGLLVPSPRLNELLGEGGGKILTVPSFNELSGDSVVLSDTVSTAVSDVTSTTTDASVQFRGRGFRTSDLAASVGGTDPVGAIQTGLNRYWSKEFNKLLISSIQGCIKADIEGDGVVVNDQFTSNLTEKLIIETLGKSGETQTGFAAVIMHPDIYNQLWQLNAIATVTAEGAAPYFTYMGMRVIIDGGIPVLEDNAYATIFAKPGAVYFGENSDKIVPVELGRDAGKNIDLIYSRRRFVMAPRGWDFKNVTVAGVSPTDAELALAGNWGLNVSAEESPFVVLRSLGIEGAPLYNA